MAQEPQTVLQATLIQALRALGVDFHLLCITATRRLDPPRPVRLLGVRVAGLDEESAQAMPDDQLSLSL